MFVTALPQILQIAKPPPLWKNEEKCSGSFSSSFILNPVRKKKHQCHILWLCCKKVKKFKASKQATVESTYKNSLQLTST